MPISMEGSPFLSPQDLTRSQDKSPMIHMMTPKGNFDMINVKLDTLIALLNKEQ